MRLFTVALAFLFTLTSASAARSPVPQSYPPQINGWHESVGQLHYAVELEIFPGLSVPVEVMTATAFAVDDHTLVTAAHVCTTAQSVSLEVRSPDVFTMTYIDDDEHKTFKGVSILKLDVLNDLCVLSAPKHPLKPLQIETNYKDNVHIFTHLTMVGAPMGIFPVAKDCQVVSKTGKEMNEKFLSNRLITSCEALPGFSGSPLISDTGKVVGVVAGGFLKSEWDPLSFASYGASSFQLLEILKGLK